MWPGSEYPGGGLYEHAGNEVITLLPEKMQEFCQAGIDKRKREVSAGGRVCPRIGNHSKMSVIHAFNCEYSLEEVLTQCGYIRDSANRWKHPSGQSGSHGVNIEDPYLNPWQVSYSHHAGDPLYEKVADAFDIAAVSEYRKPILNEEELEKARNAPAKT